MTVIPLGQTSLIGRTSADFAQELVRYSDDAGTVAFNITGYSFKFTVRENANGAVIYEATVGDGIVVTNAAQGRLEVQITAAELETVFGPLGDFRGEWELQATSPGGAKESWAMGAFLMYRGVAR
jgi:hypothetical protein